MAGIDIGNWVKREDVDGKWHLVESTVADAAITKCGRRMEPSTADGSELEVSEVEPLTRAIGQPQNCEDCSVQ